VQEGGEYGPDLALIEVDEDAVLADLVAATVELHGRMPRLQSTQWWVIELPMTVTWLRYDAVLDAQGDEVPFVPSNEEPYREVPTDWRPDLGGPVGPGGAHANIFDAVDLVLLEVRPDGLIQVSAHVDGTNLRFQTPEFPMELLMG